MKGCKYSLLVLLALINMGCSSGDRITIMAFNVENLFDNVDDPAKVDREYLPIESKQNEAHRAGCMQVEVETWRNQCLNIDWSDQMLESKLSAVAAAILQVGGGRGPDIVALQEVENVAILERLRVEYLAAAEYLPAVLVEGDDTRGIDVAFLTRLPLAAAPVLHAVEYADEFADRRGDTRGILQADFVLPDATVMTGFSVHFPAPFHPTAMRVTTYARLRELLAALPDDRHAFAAGDFNTTSREDESLGLLDRVVRPEWEVSNDLCNDCSGTSYYAGDNTWSFLDMVLWRRCCGENTTWMLRNSPVWIANSLPQQVREDGTPRRFDLQTGLGVSDHWPVVLAIEPNRNNAL